VSIHLSPSSSAAGVNFSVSRNPGLPIAFLVACRRCHELGTRLLLSPHAHTGATLATRPTRPSRCGCWSPRARSSAPGRAAASMPSATASRPTCSPRSAGSPLARADAMQMQARTHMPQVFQDSVQADHLNYVTPDGPGAAAAEKARAAAARPPAASIERRAAPCAGAASQVRACLSAGAALSAVRICKL